MAHLEGGEAMYMYLGLANVVSCVVVLVGFYKTRVSALDAHMRFGCYVWLATWTLCVAYPTSWTTAFWVSMVVWWVVGTWYFLKKTLPALLG